MIETTDLFSLDPGVAHLNHGSFGAVPVPVQRAQQRLREEMETNPTGFFTRGLLDRLAHTRRHLAAFVGADPDGTALVPNATAAVAVVLGSLFPRETSLGARALREGDEILLTDHGYGTVHRAALRVVGTAGLPATAVREVSLPLTATDDDVVRLITTAVNPGRTRLVVVDHVTSPTAKLLPVHRIVAALRELGVPVLVDAAHAPGMLDVDVTALGADFWCGNLHKWAFAPRPTALLAVAPPHRTTVRSLVVSWQEDQGFPSATEFGGTLDYTAWLAAPAGVHLLRTLGPEQVRAHNGDLAAHGQRLVASAVANLWPAAELANNELANNELATNERANNDRATNDRATNGRANDRHTADRREELELARQGLLGDPRVSMRVVPLPPGVATDRPAAMALRARLAAEHRIEVVIDAWQGHGYLRLSAQVYNRAEHYARLARALAQELRPA